MTRPEFIERFRGRMLLYMTEAWAVRHNPPSELGTKVDAHFHDLGKMLGEMWDCLQNPQPVKPLNGSPVQEKPQPARKP